MKFSAVVVLGMALAIGGCSLFRGPGSSGDEVIAQATAGGEIAYDVVKVDDQVVAAVSADDHLPLHKRFKNDPPPPELKIAVGDAVSVIVWEASGNGLFGNSLDLITARSSRSIRSALGGVFGTENRFGGGPAGSSPFGAATPGNPDRRLDPAPGSAEAGLGLGGIAAAGLAAGVQGRLTPEAAAAFATAGGQRLPSNANAAFNAARAAGATRPPTPEQARERAQELEESGRPGTRIPLQEVGTDGAITIPYAGRVPAAGRTPNEVQREVEKRLADKSLEPQVLVMVRRSPTNSVTIAGEMLNGGRVTLNPSGERLLDVIGLVGGSRAPVHETFVRLSRDGVTATVPLAAIVKDPEENLYVRPGDVLTLVRRGQTFTVFGATGRNRQISFNTARLTLSEALAKSGGLADERADPEAVFLLRYEPQQLVRALGQPIAARTPEGISPVAYRLDLRDPKAYLLAQQFPVRDKDTIFVADAAAMPFYKAFGAISRITGPVLTGYLICQANGC